MDPCSNINANNKRNDNANNCNTNANAYTGEGILADIVTALREQPAERVCRGRRHAPELQLPNNGGGDGS